MSFFDVRATHETSPTCHLKCTCWPSIWSLNSILNCAYHLFCLIRGEFVQSLLLQCQCGIRDVCSGAACVQGAVSLREVPVKWNLTM